MTKREHRGFLAACLAFVVLTVVVFVFVIPDLMVPTS